MSFIKSIDRPLLYAALISLCVHSLVIGLVYLSPQVKRSFSPFVVEEYIDTLSARGATTIKEESMQLQKTFAPRKQTLRKIKIQKQKTTHKESEALFRKLNLKTTHTKSNAPNKKALKNIEKMICERIQKVLVLPEKGCVEVSLSVDKDYNWVHFKIDKSSSKSNAYYVHAKFSSMIVKSSKPLFHTYQLKIEGDHYHVKAL